MVRVKEQYREDFMLQPGQLGCQELLDHRRSPEGHTPLHLLIDNLACRFENLVNRGLLVMPARVTHQQ